MRNIFFYGLFMDQALLTAQGLHPTVIGKAVLPDYRIHIGARATLLRSAGRHACGIVMALTDQDARTLYSETSVRAYVPERVAVELMDTGEVIGADCYNLPDDADLTGTNPAYALQLLELAETLQFDTAYVQEIATYANPSAD
ncbi:MAG: gamma-glutamylcyclotransferase family protein [Saprospiraceae bacterium]|nr:gamma-glutamylcyclotransferase family protein [Saprospiraceae bacterium]